jgi:hypothetical protein
MKRKTKIIIAAVLLGMTASSQAAIVIAGGNGSFETNTYTNPGFAGINGLWETTAGSASGWTFSGTGRWFMQTDNGGNNFGAPQDGDYYLNIALGEGGFPFSMSTAITGLTVGLNYDVEFYASERGGIQGGTSFGVSVDTTVPTSLTVTEASLPSVGGGSSNYVKQTLSFTATSVSHTFTLSNSGSGSGNGFLVDNFTVVPEPSSALLGGIGLLALLRRRRA